MTYENQNEACKFLLKLEKVEGIVCQHCGEEMSFYHDLYKKTVSFFCPDCDPDGDNLEHTVKYKKNF